MRQGQCEKCEDRGDTHGENCLIRRLIFNPGQIRPRPTREYAMEQAIRAISNYGRATMRSDSESDHDEIESVLLVGASS